MQAKISETESLKTKVFILESDTQLNNLLKKFLERKTCYEIYQYWDKEDFLSSMERVTPDLIILNEELNSSEIELKTKILEQTLNKKIPKLKLNKLLKLNIKSEKTNSNKISEKMISFNELFKNLLEAKFWQRVS